MGLPPGGRSHQRENASIWDQTSINGQIWQIAAKARNTPPVTLFTVGIAVLLSGLLVLAVAAVWVGRR